MICLLVVVLGLREFVHLENRILKENDKVRRLTWVKI